MLTLLLGTCEERSYPPRRLSGRGLRGYAAATCLCAASSLTLARNSVLSILPWKIGTPSSMHFSMTSRRSMPASRASSVGVRWIAIRTSPPGEVCARGRQGSGFTGCPQCQPAQSDLNVRSDRVGDLHERVLDPEALGQQIAERADAERLRGVVARGHEVQAELAGLGRDVLARLAGQEGVQALGGGLVQRVGGGAGDDADRPDALRAGAEHERLPVRRLAHARAQVIASDAVASERAGAADRRALVAPERLVALA